MVRNVAGVSGKTAADQRVGRVRLLLKAIGRRDIGLHLVTDVEHHVGLQPHDILKFDRVAAPGQSDTRERLPYRAGKNGPARALGRLQPSIF
jgi:hypothetical protein